jgi:hypothetical protein
MVNETARANTKDDDDIWSMINAKPDCPKASAAGI